MPSYEGILVAADRIRDIVRHTPLLTVPALDARLGGRVFFKAESLQVTGSFKLRGAANRLLAMTDEERRRGAVAWSAGNHGQALAYVGRLLSVPITILMPADAPTLKIEATRRWGADVILYDRVRDVREELGAAVAARTGASIVPPYDDPDVICGQGTVGIEAIHDMQVLGIEPDTILCPTGGGGLIAGIALAAEGLGCRASLHSVEPEGYDDTARSIAAGRLVENNMSRPSICDALLTPRPGRLTLAVNAPRLASGLTVGDGNVWNAMRLALQELKIVLEPGGAAAFAAALANPSLVRDRTTLIVLTGANLDLATIVDALGRSTS